MAFNFQRVRIDADAAVRSRTNDGANACRRVPDGEVCPAAHTAICQRTRIDSCGRAEIIGCIRGAVEIRSQSGQLGAEVACRTACVSGCLIGERFQFLQLVLQLLLCALGDSHSDIRLDLTGDAANVLAAVDRAGICIVEQIPARHARNAADIVADMLIADRAGIFADCDQTSIPARDAACGGRGEEGLRSGEIGKVERHIDLDIAETQRSVYIIDIDAAAVRAMPDGARILARNAARGVRTLPLALKRAADNLPGGLIAAHDAADLRVALHHAGERAADDSAVIFARDAAAGDLVAARSYRARNIQVCHASAGQNRAEQSGRAGVLGEIEIGDGMPAPLKRAAEGGCGRKVHAGERNVGAQDKGFALRPGIEGAVFRKRGKIGRRVQIDGLRTVCCPRCRNEREAQCKREQQGRHAGPGHSVVIHALHPPLPLSPVLPACRTPPAESLVRPCRRAD